jgi:2-dehydro-3-deoxyphosphogluconate aldolase/(4S)-4-hydroxy-2-oxoglutarate aldolase
MEAGALAAERFVSRLGALRVLPVVLLDHPASGVRVARALIAGGLPCVEVSLRSEGAIEAIALITEAFPHMLVGAGTVMRPAQVTEAAAAGAHFVASPVLDREVVQRAFDYRIPPMPSIAAASDAIAAMREGVRAAKVFGLADLRKFTYMFPDLPLVAAGELDAADIAAHAREPGVLAVASSRIVPYGASPAEIEALAAQAVAALG